MDGRRRRVRCPFDADGADSGWREVEALAALLARLALRPVDELVATLATTLGATYGLRAAGAVHRATASVKKFTCSPKNWVRCSIPVVRVGSTQPADVVFDAPRQTLLRICYADG